MVSCEMIGSVRPFPFLLLSHLLTSLIRCGAPPSSTRVLHLQNDPFPPHFVEHRRLQAHRPRWTLPERRLPLRMSHVRRRPRYHLVWVPRDDRFGEQEVDRQYVSFPSSLPVSR